MLPIVNEEDIEPILGKILADLSSWRKEMIHYIKEENPEINTAIVEIASKTDLDPKSLATGAYAIYKILELSSERTDDSLPIIE